MLLLTYKMLTSLSDHPDGVPIASREMRMRQGTKRYLWKSDVPGSPYNRSGGVEVRVKILNFTEIIDFTSHLLVYK